MQRLTEYLTQHPFLASLAVAMALAVLAFELRARRMSYAAVAPQEAIQLMNQGAQVYDLRDAAAYSAGRISGAKHLDAGQQGKAAEVLKKFKERLLVLYCEDGSTSTALT